MLIFGRCISLGVLVALSGRADGLRMVPAGSHAYVTMWLDAKLMPDHLLSWGGKSKGLKGANCTEGGKGFGNCNHVAQGLTAPRKGRESVLDLAKALANVKSVYPLLVITNDPGLLDPEIAKQIPNLVAVPVHATDFVNRTCRTTCNWCCGEGARDGTQYALHFQKLLIFGMTQYDKLMWLDTDISMRRNLDHLFSRDLSKGTTVIAQKNGCTKDHWIWHPTQNSPLCTGMMLFKPSKDLFQHMLAAGAKMENCTDDQDIINYALGKRVHNNLMKTEGSCWTGQTFPQEVITMHQCPEHINASDAVHFLNAG